MQVARTRAVALVGLTGSMVEVEADISSQLPSFVLIGLPDAALAEARDRVKAAATNAGCGLPARRITVNLSPAALPKHGSGFDLAIAMACLAAAGQVSAASVATVVHLGELSLDGRLRPIDGVLPAVLAAARAGAETVMVPAANEPEASLVGGVRVVAVASLIEAARWHGGDFPASDCEPVPLPRVAAIEAPAAGDLAEVVGNELAVEALQIAAAGGHHLFMHGPPGAGKTMLASRLPGLLPDLDHDAALEVASLRSLAGGGVPGALDLRPPFEAPHHTATAASIVGGGSRIIRPGAAPRASHGVLFLDEAPEFSSSVLDVLRQPLESGEITIHRASAVATFPAKFQLVLAANPCPCGRWSGTGAECTCPPVTRRRYAGRISGPLRDRIDIDLWVNRATRSRASTSQHATTTATARARVTAARHTAQERLAGTPWQTNAQISGAWLRGSVGSRVGRHATAPIDRALELGRITLRGYDKILKLAWTIADLEGVTAPGASQIAMAMTLRQRQA